MKRPMLITVRGKNSEWVFSTRGSPTHLAEWRADGIEVYECVATIPAWAAVLGLAPMFAAVQRAWQWLRLL